MLDEHTRLRNHVKFYQIWSNRLLRHVYLLSLSILCFDHHNKSCTALIIKLSITKDVFLGDVEWQVIFMWFYVSLLYCYKDCTKLHEVFFFPPRVWAPCFNSISCCMSHKSLKNLEAVFFVEVVWSSHITHWAMMWNLNLFYSIS